MRGRGTFLATATIGLLLLASPAAAQAADAYVDFDTGDDGLPCGAIGDPCKTIQAGINAAGNGETVHVDDDDVGYTGGGLGLSLGGGKSLIAEEFVGGDENALAEPDTIVDAGDIAIGTPAITVPPGGGGGTIRGFVIRSISYPVQLASTTTLTGNLIDEEAGMFGRQVEVTGAGNTSTIGPGNSIVDPTPATSPKAGVSVVSSAAPTITSNTFTDLNHGVQSGGGNSTISSNTFSGIRGNTNFAAIEATAGSPTITANLIQNPGDNLVRGIDLRGTTGPVAGTLRRNTILEHRIGVVVNDNEPGSVVDLNGDLIASSTESGLRINDSPALGDAAVTATNVTVADSTSFDVSLSEGALTLNSSIIGNGGITYSAGATCSISFSRGPTTGPGCDNFQTMAPPGFVNPAANDYHLAGGSAMIDMGDPTPPMAGILDLDGQARATDGNGDGVVRRDIGADEAPTVIAAPATPVAPAATPSAPVTTKKKKCKRKKRRAAAGRKKCKRKRR